MKREELVPKLKSITAEISRLENLTQHDYRTRNKYVDKFGFIHELSTQEECAKVYKTIKTHFDEMSDVSLELDIDIDEVKEKANYMGYNLDVWKSDVQARINELRTDIKIEKLYNAQEVLKKHRSEDDIFNDDIDSISDVLSLLD
jgi:hypothetical protein